MNFIKLILVIAIAPSICLAEDEVKSVEMNSGMVRSVYLNDIDVTSATNQKLKNVNVTIDSKGNIYIEGKQYQVILENSYTPLQKTPKKKTMPIVKKTTVKNKDKNKRHENKKAVSPCNEKGELIAPAQDVAKP